MGMFGIPARRFSLPVLLNTVIKYSDAWIQIYTAASIGVFFDLAVSGKTLGIIDKIPSFAVIYVTMVIAREASAYLFALLSERRKIRYKSNLYKSFLTNPLSHVDELTTGEILNRFDSDFAKAAYVRLEGYSNIIAGATSILTYCIVLGSVSLPVLAGVLILSILPVIPPITFSKYYADNYGRYQETEDACALFLKECVESIESIKLYNLYRWIEERYSDIIRRIIDLGGEAEKFFQIEMGIEKGISRVSEIGTLAWLGYLIYSHGLPIGALVQVLMLSGRITGTLRETVSQIRNFRESGVSIARLDEMKPTIQRVSGRLPLDKIVGIVAKDIFFAYRPGNNVLEKLNLTIRSSEKLAILGPNGSGKSTLVKLILGLYDCTGGALLVNGTDLRHFDKAEFSNCISWVPQENYFAPGSVFDNLRMFDSPDRDRLHALMDVFRISPEMLSRRCAELSGGEQKKIALMRGLLKPASLLVLDEPTNHLDKEAVSALKSIIGKSGKAVIIVTHDGEFALLTERQLVLNAV